MFTSYISSTTENKRKLFNGYVLPVMINELRRRHLSPRIQRPLQGPNVKWRKFCLASRYVAGREIHGFNIRLKSKTLSRPSRKKKKIDGLATYLDTETTCILLE